MQPPLDRDEKSEQSSVSMKVHILTINFLLGAVIAAPTDPIRSIVHEKRRADPGLQRRARVNEESITTFRVYVSLSVVYLLHLLLESASISQNEYQAMLQTRPHHELNGRRLT